MQLELDEILLSCMDSVGIYGKTFKPETFSSNYSSLHNEIIDVLDGPHQYNAIAAPRGIGKTSFARALCEKAILFRKYQFIVYLSQSETSAMMQTENIKRELLTNVEIKKIFGNIKIDQCDPDLDETFSKHSWVAFGETLVLPRGAHQQVRGLIFKSYRPQLIIVDDLEIKQELANPENRRKLKDWFHSDLLRCIDRYSKNYKFIYIDTLKHSEALIAELLKDKRWYSKRLELFDDNYKSNVPELFTDEEIEAEVENARDNGTLDVLFMELRNLPVAGETQSFRQEFFKYFDIVDLVGKEIEYVVIGDPAKSVTFNSAESAIVGIGVDYRSGAIYIVDVVSAKMFPDQFYDHLLNMAVRIGAHVIGVEVTGLEEFIKQPLTNAMQVKGPKYAMELIWLKARGGDPGGEKGKIKRIGSLVPYYRRGYIYHNKTCCTKLESQLLTFPSSGLVDVADATAYVIELLELGGRYFTNPPDETRDEGFNNEDEFAELEYEEPFEGWRII